MAGMWALWSLRFSRNVFTCVPLRLPFHWIVGFLVRDGSRLPFVVSLSLCAPPFPSVSALYHSSLHAHFTSPWTPGDRQYRSCRTLALILFLRPRGILLHEDGCCLPCFVSSCSRWMGFGISAHRIYRRSTVPCFHVPSLVRPCPH